MISRLTAITILGALALLLSGGVMTVASAKETASDPDLVKLFEDWRAFVKPSVNRSVPDYSKAAMAKKATALPEYRKRLDGMQSSNWPQSSQIDKKIVEAEMNGFDFFLRVLKPWARDPSFYATIFPDWSDVPAHEGPSAYPNINLYEFKFPLDRDDERKLTEMIKAVPTLLEQAKVNLKESNAKDLWTYGAQTFRDQAEMLAAFEDGTLEMRTLEGRFPAKLSGKQTALKQAIQEARSASDEFADWVAAEAKTKTGPSGIGKDNYTWYSRNVNLTDYSWEEQVTLLKRELERSLASLRLEELRNRNLPAEEPTTDAEAYRKMAEEKAAYFSDFVVASGFVSDAPYYRAAIAAQTGRYVPPEQRNFFSHVTARDPLPLYSHSSHWMDLARMKHEPHASPIRRVPQLWNIFENRSEGMATAYEELVMAAGLYSDNPRSRELVWIMLANRAARGLASLYVHSNEMDLAEAGAFQGAWTPRGWSDSKGHLVGFEQLLYARQPGYGPSYIIGKLLFERLLADMSHMADENNQRFDSKVFFEKMNGAGIIPFSLIEAELTGANVN